MDNTLLQVTHGGEHLQDLDEAGNDLDECPDLPGPRESVAADLIDEAMSHVGDVPMKSLKLEVAATLQEAKACDSENGVFMGPPCPFR